MSALLLYPLLTAACFYLGSRAKVTSWLWSRYPDGVAQFMDCAACTGFWYGFFVEMCFGRMEAFLDFEAGPVFRTFSAGFTVGLCTMVLTPLIAALMQYALEFLGTTVPPNETGSEE